MRAGQRVASKYVLSRPLGRGGMGSVWVARNEWVDADVALKILRPSHFGSKDDSARFRHEARIGSKLQHRGIARVFDLVEEKDGSLVLIMELLRGKTLEARLRESQPVLPEEAVAIAVPILAALDYMHKQGILHRDLKPSNIFLSVDPDGQTVPKLIDFGIAKGSSPSGYETVDGSVLGTPGYMSPERIRSEAGEIDHRSDIFSMAVVLYEMMTGVPPFEAPSQSARLAAVLETEVDADIRIPPMVWLEMQRSLSKRPSERHASAREMADALCKAIGHDEVSLGKRLWTAPPAPELRIENRTANGVEASVSSTSTSSRLGALFAMALMMTAVAGATALTLARLRPLAPASSSASAASIITTPATAPTVSTTSTATSTATSNTIAAASTTSASTPTATSSTTAPKPVAAKTPKVSAPASPPTTHASGPMPQGFARNPGF